MQQVFQLVTHLANDLLALIVVFSRILAGELLAGALTVSYGGVEHLELVASGDLGDAEMQTATLRAALDLLTEATEPETRVDLDATWPGDAKQAYKDWQPAGASPIVAHSLEQIRRARRESR